MNESGALPDGWARASVGEYTLIRTGKLDANAQVVGGPYPFFTCGDEILRIDKFAFDTEAVLLAGNGNFNVKWYNGKFNAYQRTYVIEPISVDGKFLYYQLMYLLPQITKGNRGSTIRFIRIGDIVSCPAAVPPIREQQRIVEGVETHVSRLDAAVGALKRVQVNLKRYRAAVLKAAVEGRLVPNEAELARREGRPYEPASALLKRILAERRARWEAAQLAKFRASRKEPRDTKWQQKYTEPKRPDTSALPHLPEGWAYSSADQCTSMITDGEHITPPRTESGVLLLSARNVLDGRLSLDDVDHVSENTFAKLIERLPIESGDVLLSCSGTVGRSCVVPEGIKFALVRSVAVLKPLDRMGRYLSFALRSLFLQEQIAQKKTQTAQANIFQGKIKELVFPVPPAAEQRRIIAEIDRRLSVLDELEMQVEANLRRAERLRQAILKRAFEGKLVPQDPTDEPASVLLERIRAERQKSSERSSTRNRRAVLKEA